MNRAVVVLALVAAGCATTHTVTALDAATTVHTFRREYNNAVVVVQGGSSFLVDTGLEGDAKALAQDLVDAGLDPKALKAVILTHGHADHAGGARHFHETYGVPVVAGKADEHMLAAGKNDPLCPTSDMARDRLEKDQNNRYQPLTAQVLVDAPLDLMALTGVRGQVLPMAGHTPGSLVVVLERGVVVGDLFRGAIVGSTCVTLRTTTQTSRRCSRNMRRRQPRFSPATLDRSRGKRWWSSFRRGSDPCVLCCWGLLPRWRPISGPAGVTARASSPGINSRNSATGRPAAAPR